MADHLKLISPTQTKPVLGGFIMTTAAKDILYTLGRAQAEFGGGMALISGAPGVGKSKAAMHFKYMNPGVFLLGAVQGEGGAWNVASELYQVLDMEPPRARNLRDDRRRLAEAFRPESMLIIDEAQYLVRQNPKARDDWEAFEWLRGMAEEACMSLAFCGDLRLRELSQIAPPLWRRLRRCVIVGTAREDVEAVATLWGIEDQKARELLFMVARKSGGALADVVNVCKEAHVMSGNTGITFEYVAAAIQELRLLGGKA